jgi:hypothetical protein
MSMEYECLFAIYLYIYLYGVLLSFYLFYTIIFVIKLFL